MLTIHWLYLAIAIVFEVAFIFVVRVAQGFTKLWPSLFAMACSAGVIYFLSLAMLGIAIAVGYTILIGGGSLGAIVIGGLFFRERVTASQVACFAVIFLGIAGLQSTVGG